MGGLWVDYHLMTTIPGLFAIGECNFSDHGANRLGASALMQGLADGYFILPYTLQHYLADEILVPRMPVTSAEFDQAETDVRERIHKLFTVKGKQSVDSIHRKFGLRLWELVGMGRNGNGLESAVREFASLKEEFWKDVRIPGNYDEINPELEKAGRVADFIEMGELMAQDALQREESCGGHFREEFQSEDGEARRDDDRFLFVAAWEYKGPGQPDELHKEALIYENIKVQTRNYKS
jgi:succinate dehydrogenase / fumarate reductase flavoprotein subunit